MKDFRSIPFATVVLALTAASAAHADVLQARGGPAGAEDGSVRVGVAERVSYAEPLPNARWEHLIPTREGQRNSRGLHRRGPRRHGPGRRCPRRSHCGSTVRFRHGGHGGALCVCVQVPLHYYGSHRRSYFPIRRRYESSVVVKSPTVKTPPRRATVPSLSTRDRFASRLGPTSGHASRPGQELGRGESMLRRGDFRAAAAALKRAVRRSPDNPAPKIALAVAWAGEENYASAAHILRRALHQLVDWNAVRIDWAEVLGGRAAAEDFQARMEEALEGPLRADAALLLGFYHLVEGRLEQAAASLRKGRRAEERLPMLDALLLSVQRRLDGETTEAPHPPSD